MKKKVKFAGQELNSDKKSISGISCIKKEKIKIKSKKNKIKEMI